MPWARPGDSSGSAQGAHDFATLRSVLSTARKQGLNRLEALLQGPDALLAEVES